MNGIGWLMDESGTSTGCERVSNESGKIAMLPAPSYLYTRCHSPEVQSSKGIELNEIIFTLTFTMLLHLHVRNLKALAPRQPPSLHIKYLSCGSSTPHTAFLPTQTQPRLASPESTQQAP